jgi:hypothetical protein
MMLRSRIAVILRDARVAGGWIDEDVAEKVLACLRNPTPAMIEAGMAVIPVTVDEIEAEDLADCYREMVDAG